MQKFISKYNKDFYGGGLMLLLGLAATLESMTYEVGTLRNMGAGFFPATLGVILMIMGAAIVLTAKRGAPNSGEKQLLPEWRGSLCIVLSIVAFIVLGKYGGLIPASFAIVFISAMGDRQNTVKSAVILSLLMVAVAVIVFRWALRMQFPLFQWG